MNLRSKKMFEDFSIICFVSTVFVILIAITSSTVSAATITRGHIRPNGDRVRKSIAAVLQPKNSKLRLNNGSPSFYRPPQLSIRGSPPSEVTLGLHESIELECEAGGSPPPEIHWLKDGHRISPISTEENLADTQIDSEEVETNSLHPNGHRRRQTQQLGLTMTRSRLMLDCFSVKDVGRYTCVAENPYQRVVAHSQVNMKESLSKPSPLNTCESRNLDIVGLSEPRINMWTHTRLELIENDVKLFCRASGSPEPEISWLGPNDTPLANNYRFQILENGDLIINHLSWKDMGSYTCIAENKLGSDKISTFVYPAQPELTD